jgi:TonB-dependent starch-binding outer membrane protein SusC
MKVTAFVLLAVLLWAEAQGQSGQEGSLSLSLRNVSVSALFDAIASQSDYQFWMDKKQQAEVGLVSIQIEHATLQQVLAMAFKHHPVVTALSSDGVTELYLRQELGKEDPPGGLGAIDNTGMTIKGRVVNERMEPLAGATVVVRGKSLGTATDDKGVFTLYHVPAKESITVSYTGYVPQEQRVNPGAVLQVRLSPARAELKEVTVYATGYQKIPEQQATGSYDYISNDLLERSVSTDILSKLDGIASGLLYNSANTMSGNSAFISIRGRSTIFSNPNPLIVLDNFPYNGNIYDINPNDIESVTVLKDAAAASIWGVQSGNGVIVISTKRGRLNQKAQLSFSANVNIGAKPNIWSVPQLSSADFIGVEQYLYNQGNYAGDLQVPTYPESPVIELLDSGARMLVSTAYANAQINKLKGLDVRYQQSKYFYQPSINQQYALNIRGGGAYVDYMVSAGYDQDLSNMVGSTYGRYTVNDINDFHLLNNHLDVSTGIAFTYSRSANNDQFYYPKYPYEQIADAQGRPLAVYHDYRKGYIDTAGEGLLQDWHYVPLNERGSDDVSEITDIKLNLNMSYKISPFLKLLGSFQYQRGSNNETVNDPLSSYYTRNLINLYSQIDYVTGVVTNNIPVGGIMQYQDSSYNLSFGRFQLNLDKKLGLHHWLSAILGTEINGNNSFFNAYQVYGYDPGTATNVSVNYQSNYPYFTGQGSSPIPDITGQGATINRNLSYYANASYRYQSRYTLTVSARKDESNLFGVNANHKGVPLGSVGFLWDIDKEPFYHFQSLPLLRFRLSDGYNGNVYQHISAFTTMEEGPGVNSFGTAIATITNPPNPDLSWEKIHVYNAGLDLGAKDNRISATLEYFLKYGLDLIGYAPVAAQTGVTQFTGNNASTRINGADLSLHTWNLKGKLNWYTDFLFSYAHDVVTTFKTLQSTNYEYIQQNYVNPLQGKPYEALFSYRWAGLDTQGNPQGYYQGKVSENYAGIINASNPQELVYSGSGVPLIFGSFRNTFTYKNIEVSFNIKYKFKYVFRTTGLNYYDLFNGKYSPQAGYDQRWQQPGDERKTHVPSMIYPANSFRDIFYNNASVLVDKGDQVRWQDIRISYTWRPKAQSKWPFTSLQAYTYINNIGLIWRANKDHLDPDLEYLGYYAIPTPISVAFGIKAIL